MALGLRQTSHSSGAALPPPFFCGCWCKFFFQRPLDSVTGTLKHVKKLCVAVRWYRDAVVKRSWRRRLILETWVRSPVATHLLTFLNLPVSSLAPDSTWNPVTVYLATPVRLRSVTIALWLTLLLCGGENIFLLNGEKALMRIFLSSTARNKRLPPSNSASTRLQGPKVFDPGYNALEFRLLPLTLLNGKNRKVQRMKKKGDHRPRTVLNTSESKSFNYEQGKNGHRDKFRCYRRFHDRGRSSDDFENLLKWIFEVV